MGHRTAFHACRSWLRVLLLCGVLGGCQRERVAFRFQPKPVAENTPNWQPVPDSAVVRLPLTTGTTQLLNAEKRCLQPKNNALSLPRTRGVAGAGACRRSHQASAKKPIIQQPASASASRPKRARQQRPADRDGVALAITLVCFLGGLLCLAAALVCLIPFFPGLAASAGVFALIGAGLLVLAAIIYFVKAGSHYAFG